MFLTPTTQHLNVNDDVTQKDNNIMRFENIKCKHTSLEK